MLTQTRLRIRKLKCDEKKPHCRRCTSTGRKCEGYARELPPGVRLSRPAYLQSGPSDPRERRALQFFCEAAGPHLSGPLDSYFWTHLVMQFSYFEPAVRHSLVSISALHEQIQDYSQSRPRLTDSFTSLIHYNKAIQEVRALDNEPLVVLVCVLFICIEFLQGNSKAALEHCRHGIMLLHRVEDNYPWAREYLTPIFRRLSNLPVYFGEVSMPFSKMADLGPDPIPDAFDSLSHAQFFIDDTMNRLIGLERDMESSGSIEESRKHGTHVQEFRERLDAINATLDDWYIRLQELEARSPTPPDRIRERGNIVLRYHTGRVWADTMFRENEMAFDEHLDRFQLMVDESERLRPIDTGRPRPKFTFEMGFAPMLCFTIMKCRHLDTRLRALDMLRTLGIPQENMWDTLALWAMCRCTIEVEHGISIDDDGKPCDTTVDWTTMPPDENRVLSSSCNSGVVTREGPDGRVVSGRMADFILRSREGKLYTRSEFVPDTSDPALMAKGDSARPQFVPAPRKRIADQTLSVRVKDESATDVTEKEWPFSDFKSVT